MNSEPDADDPHRGVPGRNISQRIFVSEYVCGGAWPEDSVEPSLAREGRAMLTAIVADLLRIPGCLVATTWDGRLGEFPWSEANTKRGESRLEVHEATPQDEAERFQKLCRASDAALIIAPEFDGILTNRVATAACLTKLLGPDERTVSLCSDKLALARFLGEHQIATVPTELVDLAEPVARWEFPVVLKPRDGAGSLQTFLVSDAAEFDRRCQEARHAGWPTQFIQQPFVSGEPISAAVIIDASGHRHILPVARQLLSANGRFEYLGSAWDESLVCWQQPVAQLINQLLDRLSGLRGYLGLDLIGATDGSVQVVDINPRLTTGYLAWRMRTRSNLAATILGRDEPSWSLAMGEYRLVDLEPAQSP